MATPRPGEPFEPGGTLPVDAWWRPVAQPIAHPWRGKGELPAAAPEPAPRGDLDLAGER